MIIQKERLSSPDIIILAMEFWDEIWRRNQFIAAGLASSSPHSKILFVELSRNILKSGLLSSQKRLRQPRDAPGNLYVFQPVHPLSWERESSRHINEMWRARQVRWAMYHLGMIRPLLWINLHDACEMPNAFSHSGVIYDITDDWTANEQSEVKRRRVIEMDRMLCQTSNLVIVCSRKLLNDKAPLCKRIALIPNGVEVEKYRCISPEVPNPIWKAGELPRPILGYTGTVHGDRLDIPLLCDIAKRHPSASIVLIGPCHLESKDIQVLKAQLNIHLYPSVAYANIPAVMRDIDCYIVPHLVNDFTESLNPLKLWECMACGIPVVSTPVAGFREYPDLIYLADNAEEFETMIRMALMEVSCKRLLRMEVAEQNGWERRVQLIRQMIDSVVQETNVADECR